MPQTTATPAQQGQRCQHNNGGNASIMRAMMPEQKGDNASTIDNASMTKANAGATRATMQWKRW
jgi:hypothetical protein